MRIGKAIKFGVLVTFSFALLGACSPSPENDPILKELRANLPAEVPQKFIPRIKRNKGAVSEVFNEGQRARQYMLCWRPAGKPVSGAILAYYPPSVLGPPSPGTLGSDVGRGLKKYRF